MFERLNEVSARAENSRIRADQLDSELLTRELIECQLGQTMSVIKSIIQRSRLSTKEKRDIEHNLTRLNGGFFDSIARTRNRASAESVTGTTRGNAPDCDDK